MMEQRQATSKRQSKSARYSLLAFTYLSILDQFGVDYLLVY